MNDRFHQAPNGPGDGQTFEGDVQKALDEALEALRWSKQHLQDRGAGLALRELETKLGLLAQALSWDADGEPVKAAAALRQARGRKRIIEQTYFDPHMEWLHFGH